MFLKYNYTHILEKCQGGIKYLVCSICNHFRCPSWCPGHLGDGVFACESCGDGICDGEQYYKIGKSYFHKECIIDNFCKEDLLLLFGATPRVARKALASCVFVGVENEK